MKSNLSRFYNVFLITLIFIIGFVFTADYVCAAERSITDSSITEAIEDEFLFDPAVPLNDIDIVTNDGIVTLSGSVNNILAKNRAERIAETVRGVRSVINNIVVKPTTYRRDIEIESDIQDALVMDPVAESYEIDVEVDNNGVVTLNGTVDSWQEKQLVKKIAMGVRGVTEINNEIEVEYKTERPDSEIKSEIEKTLRWNVLVDHALIDVEVNDGNVKLSGTVGSAAEKTEATVNAWAAGVDSVNNSGLEVKRWSRDEDLRQDKYIIKSEEEIRQAVEDALLYDPRVTSVNVEIKVSDGTVTLRGQVDNVRVKRAAAEDARNTVGVIKVDNRLKVRSLEEFSDKEVANRVRDAIENDPYLEQYEITVDVTNGTAYLYGTVDTYFEKAQADDAASGVKGVIAVDNNITVEDVYDPYVYEPFIGPYVYDYDWYDYQPGYTFKSDAEIKEDIQDQLWWSPFVDSEDVHVTVEDGMATLTGTVDTWSEYRAAAENAFEGGARWVDNELEVQ